MFCHGVYKRKWLVIPAMTVADRLDKAKVGKYVVLLFRKLGGTPLSSGGASSAGRRKIFRMHHAISSAWCNQIIADVIFWHHARLDPSVHSIFFRPTFFFAWCNHNCTMQPSVTRRFTDEDGGAGTYDSHGKGAMLRHGSQVRSVPTSTIAHAFHD